MNKGVVAVFFAMAMAFLAIARGQELTCQGVKEDIKPCFPYITSQQALPGLVCCNGMKSLRSSASANIADKKIACDCLKEAVTDIPVQFRGVFIDLPDKCGAALSFPISIDINCDTIQ